MSDATTSLSATQLQSHSLQTTFEAKKQSLNLVQRVSQFTSPETFDFQADSELDSQQHKRDPAIIAADVTAQLFFLRKLKFQYLEQNAKDKYVKSIVSDIDDAPIVTLKDNQDLLYTNERKKEVLKEAKAALAARQKDVNALAPLVEQDYRKAVDLMSKTQSLNEALLTARLRLTRLRQAHPQPRLTIPLADATLLEQVGQMQELNDEMESLRVQVKAVKDRVKSGGGEVEGLRVERAELEKSVEATKARMVVDEEDGDGRLVSLYDWYTASLALHQSMFNLVSLETTSENELRLTYRIPSPSTSPRTLSISIIFEPTTRILAAAVVQCTVDGGMQEEQDLGDIIDSHIQGDVDDVHGVVAAVLAWARDEFGDL